MRSLCTEMDNMLRTASCKVMNCHRLYTTSPVYSLQPGLCKWQAFLLQALVNAFRFEFLFQTTKIENGNPSFVLSATWLV